MYHDGEPVRAGDVLLMVRQQTFELALGQNLRVAFMLRTAEFEDSLSSLSVLFKKID